MQSRKDADVVADPRDIGNTHIAPTGQIIQRRQMEHAFRGITENARCHIDQQFINKTFIKEGAVELVTGFNMQFIASAARQFLQQCRQFNECLCRTIDL